MNTKWFEGAFLPFVRGLFVAGLCLLILLGGFSPSALLFYLKEALTGNLYFCLLVFSLILFFLSKKLNEKNYLPLILFLALVTWLLRYHFVFSYEQDFYSDFRRMWNYAIRVAEKGWSSPGSLPTERAVAYLVPLAALFGTSVSVFKIFNITVITLQNLMCASMLRRWHSPFAAVFCFLILSFVPEYYFASLIPSHDISGSFYAVTCLWIFSFLVDLNPRKKPLKFFSLFLFLSFLGLVTEINRSAFVIPWISFVFLCFYFLLTSSSSSRRVSYGILFVLLLGQGFFVKKTVSSLRQARFLEAPKAGRKLGTYFNHGHSFSSGKFRSARRFWLSYGRKIMPNSKESNPPQLKEFQFYMKAILGSDLYYNGHNRFENYLARLGKGLSKMGHIGFYHSRLQGLEKEERGKEISRFKEVNESFIRIFSVLLFLSFLLWFLDILFFSFLNPKFYLPFIYVSFFCFALGLLGETQARYFYLCWAPWGMIISGVFSSFLYRTDKEKDTRPVQLEVKGVLGLTSILILLAGTFYLCFGRTSYKIVDMRTFSGPYCVNVAKKVACQNLKVRFEDEFFNKSYAKLKLRPPRKSKKTVRVRVRKSFPLAENSLGQLAFFVRPEEEKLEQAPPLKINVYANGELIKKMPFPLKSRFVKLEGLKPQKGRLKLTFELESPAGLRLTKEEQRQGVISFDFLTLRSSL